MMSARETLIAAKQRISDPTRWCTEQYAKFANGAGCEPTDPDAVQWCAMGALIWLDQPYMSDAHQALCAAAHQITDSTRLGPQDVNDNRKTGHAGVMRMYDVAIDSLREKEAV